MALAAQPAGVGAFGDLLDLQFDPAGRRLASASSDGGVRVWSAAAGREPRELQAELRVAQKKPALCVAWGALAGARSPLLLASGAADGRVCIWREAGSTWVQCHEAYVTGAAVVVAFSPPRESQGSGGGFGADACLLAIAGGDDLGVVTLVGRSAASGGGAEHWTQAAAFPAHPGGTTALSWAPSGGPSVLASGPAASRAPPQARRRLATGGNDGAVRIWRSGEAGRPGAWAPVDRLADDRHVGAVRDVAWRPNLGVPASCLATCSEASCVGLWMQDADGLPWTLRAAWRVDGDARRLSWSRAGTLLAVSVGASETLFYEEGQQGKWEQVTPPPDLAA